MLNISNLNPNRAIKQFITAFSIPPIDKNMVLRGQQRAAVLPKNNDFVIFNETTRRRLSKTEQNYIVNRDAEIYGTYFESVYQIDFYGRDSRERAECVASMVQTTAADNIVKKFGIRLIDVSEIRNLTSVLDDDQNVERYSLDVRIGYIVKIESNEPHFTTVKPKLIEINATYKDKK